MHSPRIYWTPFRPFNCESANYFLLKRVCKSLYFIRGNGEPSPLTYVIWCASDVAAQLQLKDTVYDTQSDRDLLAMKTTRNTRQNVWNIFVSLKCAECVFHWQNGFFYCTVDCSFLCVKLMRSMRVCGPEIFIRQRDTLRVIMRELWNCLKGREITEELNLGVLSYD